jgi:hypothetical protein
MFLITCTSAIPVKENQELTVIGDLGGGVLGPGATSRFRSRASPFIHSFVYFHIKINTNHVTFLTNPTIPNAEYTFLYGFNMAPKDSICVGDLYMAIDLDEDLKSVGPFSGHALHKMCLVQP